MTNLEELLREVFKGRVMVEQKVEMAKLILSRAKEQGFVKFQDFRKEGIVREKAGEKGKYAYGTFIRVWKLLHEYGLLEKLTPYARGRYASSKLSDRFIIKVEELKNIWVDFLGG